MTAALCMAVTAAMMVWMVRCRIHIHINISYTNPANKPRRRPATPALELRPPKPTIPDPAIEREIAAALRGLGCTATRARAAARQAIGTGSFEETLRAAIQIAHKETAA